MGHEPYVRQVPDADTAIMFIHGIVGTPRHFDKLIPLVQLVPENWSVYNLLLDGHGKQTRDFAESSMKKWRAQVFDVFESLSSNHRRIILVGHSMGTLFSLQLASRFPEKISYLFLLNVPMRPGIRLFGIKNMLRLVFGKIREDHPMEVATRDACGVETTRKLWEYLLWIPRFLELFMEIHRTEKVLPLLRCPCIAFQSGKDELVMNLSQFVLRRAGSIQVEILPDSSHFYYAPDDSARIVEKFVRWTAKRTIG